MNAKRKSHHAALLRLAGFEDSTPLTLASSEGDLPHGRELSFAWLSGAIMTGLTSIMLMAAVLFVSFQGNDTFSTPYQALKVEQDAQAVRLADTIGRTGRARPVARTRSELEIIEASIRETVDGVGRIRRQPFERLRATLATSATAVSADIPAYDPNELLSRNQPIAAADDDALIGAEIYGNNVEGEIAIQTSALPMQIVPASAISDRDANAFVRSTLEGAYAFADTDNLAIGYAPTTDRLTILGIETGANATIGDIAENVTIAQKLSAEDAGREGRTERVVTIRETRSFASALTDNGFSESQIGAITATLRNVYPSDQITEGSRFRILFGPSRTSATLIPYRLSVYTPAAAHVATVALTDNGRYVLGTAPAAIAFTDEDTEQVDVANLPSIYRSIFETGRKHDLDDPTIERIISMFAFDLDLTKRIEPGDSIELLMTEPDAEGDKDLLYVGLHVGGNTREMFRYRTDDGVADFFDENGQTGKKFLLRRPVEGGGRLSSRYGYRVHPIFKTRKLHTGIDLSARTGTPIYAGGDGVIKRAQWVSGYGRYIEITHANGYSTAYAHQSRFADGIKAGVRVRQGQLIGYVGSTGYSTGPHLHYEVKINNRTVDPLSVRLPRDKTLPNQYANDFGRTVTQIRELMSRESDPLQIASLN